jgi:Family of unknown function (DUF5752)
MSATCPFFFYTERRLVLLTGRRARTLAALGAHLREVSGSSVFYHTHHQYLSQHFQRPRFYNDFALWSLEALQEAPLAERLAAIDLLTFTAVRPLREAIVAAIDARLAEPEHEERRCPPGDEFHFCESQSFIMPTGVVADDVRDFFRKLPKISNVSLFFHFFEARLRLGRPTNDFSLWLATCGEPELARAIDALDPYMVTLDELKHQIIRLGGER